MKTRRTILAVMGLTCLALSLIFFTGGFDWITRTAQKFATDRRAMQLAVEHISTNYGSKTASASWPRHRNNQIFVLVTFLPRTPGGDAIVIIDDKATQVLQVIPGY